MTETEKMQLAIRWASLPTDRRGRKIGVTALEVRRLGVPKVVVQHDGAPPHVGKDAEARIDEFGATLDPPIVINRQPSQSPDTNICDIAFFRALASCVAKRRRLLDRARFDLEQLAKDVEAAFLEYKVSTLDQMWSYKSELMKKIIEAEGGNWYDKRSGRTATGQIRN